VTMFQVPSGLTRFYFYSKINLKGGPGEMVLIESGIFQDPEVQAGAVRVTLNPITNQ